MQAKKWMMALVLLAVMAGGAHALTITRSNAISGTDVVITLTVNKDSTDPATFNRLLINDYFPNTLNVNLSATVNNASFSATATAIPGESTKAITFALRSTTAFPVTIRYTISRPLPGTYGFEATGIMLVNENEFKLGNALAAITVPAAGGAASPAATATTPPTSARHVAYDEFCYGSCPTPTATIQTDTGPYHIEIQRQMQTTAYLRNAIDEYDKINNVTSDVTAPITGDSPLRIVARWWKGEKGVFVDLSSIGCQTEAWGFGNRNSMRGEIDGWLEKWNGSIWENVAKLNSAHGTLDNTDGNPSSRDCYVTDISVNSSVRQLTKNTIYRLRFQFKPEGTTEPGEASQLNTSDTAIADEFTIGSYNGDKTHETTRHYNPNGWNIEVESSAATAATNLSAFNWQQDAQRIMTITDDVAGNVASNWINIRYWYGPLENGQIPACDEAAWKITSQTIPVAYLEEYTNGQWTRIANSAQLTIESPVGKGCVITQIRIQGSGSNVAARRALNNQTLYRVRVESGFPDVAALSLIPPPTILPPPNAGEAREETTPAGEAACATIKACLGILDQKMVRQLVPGPWPTANVIQTFRRATLTNAQVLAEAAKYAWEHHGLNLPTGNPPNQRTAGGQDGTPVGKSPYSRFYYSGGGQFDRSPTGCSITPSGLVFEEDTLIGTESGGDCGGFIFYLLRKIGKSELAIVNRSEDNSRINGMRVNLSNPSSPDYSIVNNVNEVRPGDIVFFHNKTFGTRTVSGYHVVIATGGQGMQSELIGVTAYSDGFSDAAERSRSTTLRDQWGGIYKTTMTDETTDRASFNTNVTGVVREFIGAIRLKGNFSS